MAPNKLKIALGVALAVALASTGTGLVSFQTLKAGPPTFPNAAVRQPVARLTDDAAETKKDDADGGEEVPGRDAASDKLQSWNNLRQIGLAMHKYHDTHGHFPTATIYDKNDKPLFSWRVAILPFIDESELYKEFRQEPWDSAHNKKLLARMPAAYKAPGIKTNTPNTTYYQLIAGKGAIFDGMIEIKIPDIVDGTANTILVIEAEKPVLWSKPEDLTYDPDKPLPKFGGVFTDGFNFLSADGATHFCQKGFDEHRMRAAITRAGGERVDLDNLQP
ncbi:MAG TPA: DUF1559 domain-containing protein [Gemmataceae bacterium]|nr:DUF1559 domain-containing protein [Gemmataceae bacterium]